MKKSLLYILAVLVGSLLFGACDKHDSASDPAPNSYSEFFINPPSFNSPSGSKVYWDDDGLWWSPYGDDLVLFNGTQFQIIKGDGNQWKTRSTESEEERDDVGPIDGVFYCCYIGQDPQTFSLEKEDGRYLYRGVNFANIVPLVGASEDNKMTLKPCCAVLKFINLTDTVTSISFNFPLGTRFRLSGDLDPAQALVVNTPNGTAYNVDSFKDVYPDANGTAYVIMPMSANSYTTNNKVTFKFKQKGTKKTNGPVTIIKGYIYVIDYSQL